MEVGPSGDADESQTSALDDAVGENADADVSEATLAEHEEKRIDEIMSFVTEIYQPDPSKLIMKGKRQFVLPPWATDRDSAKCTFCEGMCKVDQPVSGEAKPVRMLEVRRIAVDCGRHRHGDVRNPLVDG